MSADHRQHRRHQPGQRGSNRDVSDRIMAKNRSSDGRNSEEPTEWRASAFRFPRPAARFGVRRLRKMLLRDGTGETEGRRGGKSYHPQNCAAYGAAHHDLLALSRQGRQSMSWTVLDKKTGGEACGIAFRHDDPAELSWEASPPPEATGRSSGCSGKPSLQASKYSKTGKSVIEVGGRSDEKETVYFGKDNGVGSTALQRNAVRRFQRLHNCRRLRGDGRGAGHRQARNPPPRWRVWAEDCEGGAPSITHFRKPARRG